MRRFKPALAAICMLAVLLGGCSIRGDDTRQEADNVLIHFDRKDKARMDTFIHRAQHRQFDYVVAVVPTFEGGILIYDLMAKQGGGIKLSIDATRDAYGSSGVQTLQCSDVDWTGASGGGRKVKLTKCSGGTAEEATVLNFD